MKDFNEIIDSISEAIKAAGQNEELFNEIDQQLYDEEDWR